MAEHVFESPLVEEFYNSCHLKSNGRFCGVGAKGKGVGRVPMSDAARASNAALRGKAAKTRRKMAAKQAQSKGAMEKMAKSASKIKAPAKYKDYGSGKTDPGALKLTQKYGTRQAPGKYKAPAPKAVAPKAKKEYGSGKTEPGALSLTKRFGTASRGKKVVAPPKYGTDKYGSGKTEPKALSLTEKYGTRRK
jgi:hypothetical protein